MTKMTLIIGVVAVVLVGGLLFAGVHAKNSFAHGGDRFRGCMVDSFAYKLDLETDQRDQLMQIAEEVQSKYQEMRALKEASKKEMFSELRKESIDKEVLDSLYGDAKSRFDEMYALFSTRFMEFHQTLTPEQKEKLVAEMEKHRERHRGFHHRWNDKG